MARPRRPDQEPGQCEERGCTTDTRYLPGGPEDRFHGLCRSCYNSYMQGAKSEAAIAKREAKLPNKISRIMIWITEMKDDGFLNATEANTHLRFWKRKWQSLIDKQAVIAQNDAMIEESQKQAERESWKHSDPETKPN